MHSQNQSYARHRVRPGAARGAVALARPSAGRRRIALPANGFLGQARPLGMALAGDAIDATRFRLHERSLNIALRRALART